TTTTTTVSSTTTTTTVSSTTTTTTVSSTATITTVPSTTTTTSVPSTTTTTTPSPIYYNSSSCNNSSLLPVNGSCKPIDEVQNEAFQAIRSNGSCLNASALAYYLTVYSAAIAHSNLSSNLIDYLSPEEIDEKVGCLNGDAIVFANTSFLISTPLKKGEDAVIGAWFSTEHGSGNITNSTVDERLNNTFSAAAVIQVDTLIDVRYLKLFLIGDPKNYRYVNTSMNGVLVSSVIVASLSNTTHTSGRMNISLYFRNQATKILAVNEVRNGTILNGTDLALRLTVYYASIMDCATILNECKILTLDEVEAIVRRLNDRIVVFSPESHIVVHSINESNDTVIGASFQQNSPSQTIFNSNKSVAINSRFSSAAIFHPDSLIDATSIPTETSVITSFPYVVSSRTTTTITTVPSTTTTTSVPSTTTTTSVPSTTTTTSVPSTTTTTSVPSTTTTTSVPSTTTNTSVPSTTTTTTPSPIYYNSSSCNNSSLLPVNGLCKPIDEVQKEAFQAIRSNDSCRDASTLAYYLATYTEAIARQNFSSNLTEHLSPEEIDEKVGCLNDTASVVRNTSFLISTPLKKGEDAVIGAWLLTEHGGGNITHSTVDERLKNNFSAAAVIQVDSLIDATYLKLFLIGIPKDYLNVSTSMNGVLVSSVIVASLSNTTHTSGRMNISLYFQNQTTK
ncbi:unnamed protein product, partial [Rotaria sp. Silwood2]